MSKINQIQRELQSLDGGAFQKLADAYLVKVGHWPVVSVGSVAGANKTRHGTPDAFVPLDNGNYIFAEYTTKESRIVQKFLDDLEKCFDETKTGIPVQKIERVILCCSSDINTSDMEILRREAQERRVKLDVFDLQTLSHALLYHYPGLADDHLHIKVDTRQILPLDEFIAAYGRYKLAAPLSTTFQFRSQEVESILQGLEENNAVIITGPAGVGKSRLAVESCRKYISAHSEYTLYGILNRGTDIYDDLRAYFSAPGHFLVFVDDANRLPGFTHVLEQLVEQKGRTDQRIKVVATVRDYAAENVREELRKVDNAKEVALACLTSEEIRDFVKTNCGIDNPYCLSRIDDVARGNPRLAWMAASVALETDDLASLNDVSGLYEAYYKSIREQLEELGQPSLLKAAAITAFYRAVNRTQEDQVQHLQKVFGITIEDFWESARQLHGFEILDMYDNEAVKTSDQVLSTYLIYYAFFKEKVLDFRGLFLHSFPEYSGRLLDAINSLLSAFDTEVISTVMEPIIRTAWKQCEEAENEADLLNLLRQYNCFCRSDVLIFVKQRIARIEKEVAEIEQVVFDPKSSSVSSPILGILASYSHASRDDVRIAVKLMLDYVWRKPADMPQVVRTLTDGYGFEHDSVFRDYEVQKIVLDEVWERAQRYDPLFLQLFLVVAKAYMHLEFREFKGQQGNTVQIITFNVNPTPSLLAIRRQTLECIFSLALHEEFKGDVLSFLRSYRENVWTANVPKALTADAEVILTYIVESFNGAALLECVIAQDYLNFLEERGISFDATLRERFNSEAYTIYDLVHDRHEHEAADEDSSGANRYQRLREKRRRNILDYVAGFNADDYEKFLAICRNVLDVASSSKYTIKENVYHVLKALSGSNALLFVEVVSRYLKAGESLSLQTLPVSELIACLGARGAYQCLNAYNYPSKHSWLLVYHYALPSEDITQEGLDDLYTLIRTYNEQYLHLRFRDILKYQRLNAWLVPDLVEILLAREASEPDFRIGLASLFHSCPSEKLADFFADDVEVLKSAYLHWVVEGSHDDRSQVLSAILDLDSDFIELYINVVYDFQRHQSRYNNSATYEALWLREDYEKVMGRAVGTVLEGASDLFVGFGNSLLKKFFVVADSSADSAVEIVLQRQDQFLTELIQQHHKNRSFMRSLFGFIATLGIERRRAFLGVFLQNNQDFEDFRSLPLHSNFYSASGGSFVSVHRARADYLETLIPLVDSVELLEHKGHLKEMVRGERERAQAAQKEDFMGD